MAESRAAARSSPFIEQLRDRGIEVLLLGDRIDEWVMGQLKDFEGKPFKDAARGGARTRWPRQRGRKKEHEEQLKESKTCSSA